MPEVQGLVDADRGAAPDAPRDLLVEQHLPEAVDAHGHSHRLCAVQQPGHPRTDGRPLPGRAGGEVQEPARADRLLDPPDALEVHRTAEVDAPLAVGPLERHRSSSCEQGCGQVLPHRLLGGGEPQVRILPADPTSAVDGVEEGDRLGEVRLMVGQEHDATSRQGVEPVTATHVHAVEDREVGDRETPGEGAEQRAAHPDLAAPGLHERIGRLVSRPGVRFALHGHEEQC